MALKTFNPTTPGQRQLVIVDRSGLWKGKPVKTLTEGLTKKGGRNNTGRITAQSRWRSQADLPHGRFQASQVRRRLRSSGSNTIRTGPHSLR
jgi:ribosomal protein L2